jgi:hypothetical protein
MHAIMSLDASVQRRAEEESGMLELCSSMHVVERRTQGVGAGASTPMQFNSSYEDVRQLATAGSNAFDSKHN